MGHKLIQAWDRLFPYMRRFEAICVTPLCDGAGPAFGARLPKKKF